MICNMDNTMDNTSIRNLHTIMVQIDESDPIDISMPDISDFEDKFGKEPDYDEEENHSLDPDDDWLDSPKASEIGLSKDFDKFDPYTDHKNISPYDDDLGEDPWGIGEGDDMGFDADTDDDSEDMGFDADTDEEGDDEDWIANKNADERYGPIDDVDDTSGEDSYRSRDIEAAYGPRGTDDLGDDPWGIGEGDEDAGVPDDIQISQDDDIDDFVPDDIQLNERDVREMTNKVWEAMNDGMMDPRDVADAALKYMSEDDVADMVEANDWTFLFADEDEDDDEGEGPY